MLLNTSFNNHAEPIVDSAREAIACFLTTDLQALVLGDWLVTKREPALADWQTLRLEIPAAVAPVAGRRWVEAARSAWMHEARFTYRGKAARLSPELYALLGRADGKLPLGELGLTAALLPELRELWGNRMVRLTPA